MIYEKIKINKEREIRIFNTPILQYGKKEFNGVKEKYCDIFPKSFEEGFLDKIIEKIGTRHDLVCLIRSTGTGEAYLTSIFIQELIKKYKAKSPCIVYNKKSFENIIRVFNKHIPIYYTENISYPEYCSYLKHPHIKYKGMNFVTMLFPLGDLQALLRKYAKSEGTNYITAIKKSLDCNEMKGIYPEFSAEEKSVTEIVKDLNLDNFVFVVLEANSVKSLPKEFQIKLFDKLKRKNKDIFINTESGICEYGKSAKISISQAMYLASLSKGIIAVRCGFSELLSMFKVQKHIIYTPWKWEPISPKNMLEKFTLSQYPLVDNNSLYEYEYENNPDEIIDKIIEKI